MNVSRETVMQALFDVLQKMLNNAATPAPPENAVNVSRRLMDWNTSPKPALYLTEMAEHYTYQSENLSKVAMDVKLFYYFDAGNDPNSVPATILNTFLDALDATLAPDDGDPEGKFTLGGLVSHCYIKGEILKVTGDLDGEGMAVIPLEILVP